MAEIIATNKISKASTKDSEVLKNNLTINDGNLSINDMQGMDSINIAQAVQQLSLKGVPNALSVNFDLLIEKNDSKTKSKICFLIQKLQEKYLFSTIKISNLDLRESKDSAARHYVITAISHPKIKQIKFNTVFMDSYPEKFPKDLNYLEMTHCGMSTAHLSCLTDSLQDTDIETLNLSHNNFNTHEKFTEAGRDTVYSRSGGVHFKEKHLRHALNILFNHPTLKSLDLNHTQLKLSTGSSCCFLICFFGSPGVRPAKNIARNVAKGLTSTTSQLINLNMQGNQISNHSMKILAQALAQNTTIKKLNLSGNEFTDSSVPALVNMIRSNNSIHELSLEEMNFGNKSNRQMREACISNPFLKTFHGQFEEEVNDEKEKENEAPQNIHR